MANQNAPFGFRPIGRVGGAPFSVVTYGKLAADANAIYLFDMVGRVTGSLAMPESPANLLPAVRTAYDSGTLVPGTAMWVGASLGYGKASTASVHPVTDQVDVVYLAQAKTGTVVSTDSMVGRAANIDHAVPGSTSTKESGLSVDTSSLGTTKDVRITRVSYLSSNAEGDSAILEIVLNRAYNNQGALGVTI